MGWGIRLFCEIRHVMCCRRVMFATVSLEQSIEFTGWLASHACDDVFEEVQFSLFTFGFIRVTHGVVGVILERRDRLIYDDDSVKSVIDGIVMGDEGVREGFRSDEPVGEARVGTQAENYRRKDEKP